MEQANFKVNGILYILYTTLLDCSGEGSFGFQDYRTQATQRVLSLRGEGISGLYNPSRYNFYTKPGLTVNGISTLSIRSQYGADAESGDLFTLAGNGNVGIGNGNPLSKLVVGNSMGTGYGATIDSSGTRFGTIVRTYSSTPSTDNNASLWVRNVNTTTSTDTTLFRVNNNGNVGVGTNDPSTALDVSGTTNITGNLSVDTNTLFVDASNNRVGVGTTTPSSTLEVRKNGVGYVGVFYNTSATGEGMAIRGGNTSSQNSLVVQNYDGNNQILIARSDGNVGIGTSTPACKLSILGSTNLASPDNDLLKLQSATGSGASDVGISMWAMASGANVNARNWKLATNFQGHGLFQILRSTSNTGVPNINAMTIDKDGNTGIGTTTPTTLLDCYGEGSFGFQDYRTQATQRVLSLRGEGISGLYNPSRYNFYTKPGLTVNGISTLSIRSQYGADAESGDLFTLAGNGNVGIGTTTPQAKLDVATGNGVSAIFSNANGANNFNSVQLRGGTIGSSVNWQISKDNTLANSLQIAPSTTNAGTTFATPIFTIENNGNVGIGKTTPQAKLDVSGNLMVSRGILGSNAPLFADVSNNRVGIAMRAQNPAAPLHVQSDLNNSTQVIISGGGSHTHTNRGLRIATYQASSSDAGVNLDAQTSNGELTFSTAGNPKMTIKNDGNVGIGTTTPAYPLDVSGSAKFTTIRDSANLVGTSGQVLSSTGSALSWITPTSSSFGAAVLRETTSATTNSNVSFTNNVRTLRQINDIQFNSLGITLSLTPNWTITIPTAGTYIFRARGTYAATSMTGQPYSASSKLFIKNESESGGLDDWIVGENSRYLVYNNINATIPFNYQAECNGIQTITGSTTISLRQVCIDVSNSASKFGGVAVNLPSGQGVPEIYATLEIQRIA